jgi:hypothetical protein
MDAVRIDLNLQFVALISSLIGGASVALITHLFTRPRTTAEARKLDAEAEIIKVKTRKLLAELTPLYPIPTKDKLPEGWFKTGSDPQDYDMGIDDVIAYSGTSSGFITGLPHAKGFGTLMQSFRADNYRGSRVRLSGFVKAKNVTESSALWMRIDQPGSSLLDNMSDRPIEGTRDWTKYSIVLDVALDASEIAFGVLLAGSGRVWIDSLELSTVEPDVPVTKQLQYEPLNLDFE